MERGPDHPKRYDNRDGTCHCGHSMHDSDHCPACGCEEFESGCDYDGVRDPDDRCPSCEYDRETMRIWGRLGAVMVAARLAELD